MFSNRTHRHTYPSSNANKAGNAGVSKLPPAQLSKGRMKREAALDTGGGVAEPDDMFDSSEDVADERLAEEFEAFFGRMQGGLDLVESSRKLEPQEHSPFLRRGQALDIVSSEAGDDSFTHIGELESEADAPPFTQIDVLESEEDEDEAYTNIDDVDLDKELKEMIHGSDEPVPGRVLVIIKRILARKAGFSDDYTETPIKVQREMARALKDMLTVKAESGWDFERVLDKFEAFIDAVDTTVGLIDTVSGYVSELTKGDVSAKAEAVSEYCGAISSVLGVISPIIAVFKQAAKVKSCFSDDEEVFTTGDKAREVITLGRTLASAGRAILVATKDVMGLVTKIPGPLKSAVPGLSIVIAAIEIALRSLDLWRDVRNYMSMGRSKDRMRKSLSASDSFEGLFTEKGATNTETLRRMSTGSKSSYTLSSMAQEYELVRDLKKVNRKRIIRESMRIAIAGMNLTADALKIAGVSAQAGLALNISSSVLGTGSTAFRKVKQKWHDKGYGNQEKTSRAKDKARIRQVRVIFRMISSLDSEDTVKASEVASYIRASGCSVQKFVRHKDKTKGRVKMLYGALKKREG
ncbi:hypothetical protein FUAX_37820 [Fulvitalea axinellae]|uniref:Uncharacterized protein n=1 Tax=Fulvitalea axinellae TaxID=1182444 RepID=A0AAU9DJH1_9BACT|nr:hypothetical protein FUAX_37820 [Fulvitalea axinellae]